ncbi:hypothetical protein PGT21_013718 [Puccinia graminis f. sp. tritici]|uniref:Uncharacterized protein n=1 Tax=Puccinia graminis f. sp. tritici TaxID=56615 RepID=A0A5B0R168_PUCGR|nr:hypothetical protein PGT21_013718 [Puccinia graminis f. sp. tritici]
MNLVFTKQRPTMILRGLCTVNWLAGPSSNCPRHQRRDISYHTARILYEALRSTGAHAGIWNTAKSYQRSNATRCCKDFL